MLNRREYLTPTRYLDYSSSSRMKRPYDYGERTVVGKYPHDIHRVGADSELDDGPVCSGNQSSLWYRQREAYAIGNLYDLGFHGYQSRDKIASGSASHTDHGCRPLGDPIHIHGGSLNSYSADPVGDGGECSLELLRKLREGGNMGDSLLTCPVDPSRIMHASQNAFTGRGEEHFKYRVDSSGIPFGYSSKSVLNDKGKEPLFASRMKETQRSPQSRTNLSMPEFTLHAIMDKPWKRKHTDNSSLLADKRSMALNGNCSDYDDQWRQTGRIGEGDSTCKNVNMKPLVHYQGRPFERHSSHIFSGSDDRHDNMHLQSPEPWMSARSKGILDETSNDYVTDYGWRDRRRVDEIDSKCSDPDFPRYSKTSWFCYDNSQEILASGLLPGGGSELMHRRHPETYTSQFRTDGCGGSLGGTANDYFTRFQEREMGGDQWRVESVYNNYSHVEDYNNIRTFSDDSLHKVTDGKSVSIHEYPSERSGTGNDYYTSICEKEMNGNGWREQRRFDSTYKTYTDAEPSRTLKVRPRHDSCSHRVSTSGPPMDNRSDYMHGHQSERSAFSNRQHSPLKKNRHNAQYDRESVEKFEKEKDCQDKNVCNNLQKPCNGQSKKHAALLNRSESIRQSELNENSEEFKQRVHIAYLRFSKLLNENSEQKKRYQVQGESGSLVCAVCGRHSKYFVDAHSLAMHTYDFQKADLLAEHRGLYKALCVFLGWNQDVPPDNTRSYQSLSLAEARLNQENLILWPPLVIVQNARIGQGKSGQWEGIGNPEMDELLKELGFGSGKSKALYGKEGHKGIILVKFSSSFVGLQEAERLHKYFEGYCRGRKDWLRLQSLHMGKEINDEDLDFVRIDKETKKKRRVLYGYIGIAEDLNMLHFDTRKRVLVKSRKDTEKNLKDQ